jgi:hypothetical protein
MLCGILQYIPIRKPVENLNFRTNATLTFDMYTNLIFLRKKSVKTRLKHKLDLLYSISINNYQQKEAIKLSVKLWAQIQRQPKRFCYLKTAGINSEQIFKAHCQEDSNCYVRTRALLLEFSALVRRMLLTKVTHAIAHSLNMLNGVENSNVCGSARASDLHLLRLLQVQRLLTHKWGQFDACVHDMRQKACPWHTQCGNMKAHECGHSN